MPPQRSAFSLPASLRLTERWLLDGSDDIPPLPSRTARAGRQAIRSVLVRGGLVRAGRLWHRLSP